MPYLRPKSIKVKLIKGRLLLACLPLLTLPSAATAEDAVLPTVTVRGAAASGVAGLPAAVPQEAATTTVSRVSAGDIEQQQMRRLEDALTTIPGVTISAKRGVGLPRSVVIRGLGPRNVRFFIDGIEMSDTSQSQSQFPVSELNMDDVESIEVLRGPQPGRFGSDNGGGVVNITTKRPSGPLSGQIGGEYGSYATSRGWGSVSGVQGPLDYRLSASSTYSHGYSDFNSKRGGVAEDPFRQMSGGLRLGLQATENLRFDVTGRIQKERLAYDASSAERDWSRDEVERQGRLAATLNLLDGRLVNTLGVARTDMSRQYWGFGTAGDTYDGHKTRIDYVGALTAAKGVNVSFGVDATRESMEQHTPGFAPANPNMSADFWKNGAFTTLGVTPAEGLDLTATVRGDRHTDFGGRGTWRLGGAYAIADTGATLRAAYGTAWQTPSLYERYDPCYGRGDLRPEYAKAWDAGISQSLLGGKVQAGVTYFRAKTEDQINWIYGAPVKAGCSGGSYVNVDRTRAQGVETELEVRPLQTVALRASYTWQMVEDAKTNLLLADRPRHRVAGSAGWQATPDLNLNAGVTWRDTIIRYGGKGDAYLTVDLRGAYDLTDTVRVTLRVENLFNAAYEEEFGYGTPGRSAYVGLSTRF